MHIRSTATLVLTLAVAAIAFAPVGIAPASASASAAGSHANRVVLSPQPRQVVRSNHVRLRLRSSGLSGALTASLNGVRIDEDFARPRHGIRDMKASASHGLRRGRNVLRVKVLRRDLAPRRATVRFFARHRGALVGAGRDRRVAVGSKALLSGTVRPVRRRASRSKLRWRIVKGPRAGDGSTSSPARKPLPARLISRAGSTAGFKPLALGRYIVELRHGAKGNLTTDRVTLDVVPASPMVPIETVTKGQYGSTGITVGGKLYPGNGNQFIQMLVLKRKTLALVTNESFYDASSLQQRVAQFDDTDLVIVNRNGSSSGGFMGFSDSLNRIGLPDLDKVNWNNPYYMAPQAGEFSAIGVPGMAPGTGEYRLAMSDSRNPDYSGDMRGYLIPDQYRNYGFVPSDRQAFEYGGRETEPGNPAVGYKVRVQDSHTLLPEPGNGAVFETNSPNRTEAQHNSEADRMTAALKAVAPGNLVTIQTMGKRKPGETNYQAPIGAINKSSMGKLAAAVAAVGGTRNGFNQAALVRGLPASGGAVYTLVGWAGAKEGEGAEVAAGVDNAGDAPILNGVLRPDRASQFKPNQVVNSVDDPATLSELSLKQPTTAWPLDDNPGAKRAIAFLGSQDEELGPDPRSAYWTQELDTDALIRVMSTVAYPAGKDFTQAQFEAARSELVKELGWVGKVRRYLARLSTPFADNALPGWEASKTIADRVYDDAHPDRGKVSVNWLEITNAIIGLIPVLGPEAKAATEVFSTIAEFSTRVYGAVDQGGEPSDRDVSVESDKLGAELLAQAQAAQATFRSMGDVIVSDYAKLSALGPHAGCNATAPDCPREFAFSEADRAAASASVYRGIERVAFTKLLPLGYHVFQLKRLDRATRPNPKDYWCNSAYPWSNYPDPIRSSTALLQELDPVDHNNSWDTYVLSGPKGFWDIHGTPPSDELLARMFGPVSQSGDPKAGGLALPFSPMIPDEPDHWAGSTSAENIHCGM